MIKYTHALKTFITAVIYRTAYWLAIVTGAMLVFLVASIQSSLANNQLPVVRATAQQPAQSPVPQQKPGETPKPASAPTPPVPTDPSTVPAAPSPTTLPTPEKLSPVRLDLEPVGGVQYFPIIGEINNRVPNLSGKLYEWYLSGESHLERDEFDLAVQSFSDVISLSPEFAEVYLKRAECYANLNQISQAQADLHNFNRFSTNKTEAALKSLEVAQRFEASAASAASNRKTDEAISNYQKGLVFGGPFKDLTVRTLLAIADLFYTQQNYTKALESYQRAVTMAPQDPDVLFRLMAAKSQIQKSSQNFTQSDCEALSRLSPTPFSDLVCGVVKKEGERLAASVKPLNLKQIFDEDEVTEKVQILDQPAAEYTTDAREQKLTGTIELSVVFPPSGEVAIVEVLKALPSPKLVEAAKKSARLIKFTPARVGSIEVAQRKVVVYSYPPAP